MIADHDLEAAYLESWHTYSVTKFNRYMPALTKVLIKRAYHAAQRELLRAGYTRQQVRQIQLRQVGEEMGR